MQSEIRLHDNCLNCLQLEDYIQHLEENVVKEQGKTKDGQREVRRLKEIIKEKDDELLHCKNGLSVHRNCEAKHAAQIRQTETCKEKNEQLKGECIELVRTNEDLLRQIGDLKASTHLCPEDLWEQESNRPVSRQNTDNHSTIPDITHTPIAEAMKEPVDPELLDRSTSDYGDEELHGSNDEYTRNFKRLDEELAGVDSLHGGDSDYDHNTEGCSAITPDDPQKSGETESSSIHPEVPAETRQHVQITADIIGEMSDVFPAHDTRPIDSNQVYLEPLERINQQGLSSGAHSSTEPPEDDLQSTTKRKRESSPHEQHGSKSKQRDSTPEQLKKPRLNQDPPSSRVRVKGHKRRENINRPSLRYQKTSRQGSKHDPHQSSMTGLTNVPLSDLLMYANGSNPVDVLAIVRSVENGNSPRSVVEVTDESRCQYPPTKVILYSHFGNRAPIPKVGNGILLKRFAVCLTDKAMVYLQESGNSVWHVRAKDETPIDMTCRTEFSNVESIEMERIHTWWKSYSGHAKAPEHQSTLNDVLSRWYSAKP